MLEAISKYRRERLIISPPPLPPLPSGSEWVELKRQTEAGGGSSTNTSTDQSGHAQPASSGLRTHQTRNLWTESIKLVVWSGATWMLEVASFVVTSYLVTPSEAWYDYLWYLPSTINALRGVGIFSILVLTPENRVKVAKALGTLGSWAGSGTLGRASRSEAHSSSGNHAQIDTRRSSVSSESSSEGFELDAEAGAGGRRKSSIAANFGMVSLPSVDEEDVLQQRVAEPSALRLREEAPPSALAPPSASRPFIVPLCSPLDFTPFSVIMRKATVTCFTLVVKKGMVSLRLSLSFAALK
ncbi:hypothetical protein C7M84_013777 [Penaeus vannamei]|uniref:Uncharacterized protein n=1 Tax=Penaeus vannamei TaxID=6689 RepID=A0A3R7QI21_PENVA|nr:hypothetical protein C7M84_013777 [Penaeus vannamei]